jgi:UrcA family protein
MKGNTMSRSILAAASVIAVAAFSPQQAAMAQASGNDTVGNPIVVSAPRLRQSDERTKGVHPRMQIVARALVDTGGLDLRTQAGRDALDARVEAAAEEVCAWIDEVYPPVGVGADLIDNDCEHQAVRRAQAQVQAAIRAGG